MSDPTKNAQVLIVDDQEDFAEGIAEVLEMNGYDVRTAFSRTGALEKVGQYDFKVALVDLCIGNANGLDLIGELRTLRPGMLCLIMTAYADVESAITAVQKGAYHYLRKPISTGDLLATLGRCFEKIRLETEKQTAEEALRIKNQELEEINKRLRKVVASTKGLASCAYLDGFGELLLKEFSRNMAAQGGSIYMIRQNRLELIHTLDPDHSPSHIEFPLKNGSILQTALESKEPLLISDLDTRTDMEPSGWLGYKDGSVLVFPLVDDNDDILGIVSLHNRLQPPFTEQDKELGTLLASHSCETIRALRAVDALKERELAYSNLFNNLVDIFFRTDLDGNLLTVSPSFEHILGYPIGSASAMNLLRDVFSDSIEGKRFIDLAQEKGTVELYDAVFQHKNGSKLYISINARLCVDVNGFVFGVEGIARDTTKITTLESQLRQAQKMEAIGTLAGGIAHDFNNILSSIMGYSELAILDLPRDSRSAQHLEKVLRASNRAKDLVAQILAFSRKEEHELVPVDLKALIFETLKLIRASLPATIDIQRNITTKKSTVLVDQTQLHQVIINICTNARHAMREKGGVLEIRLDEAVFDGNFHLSFPDLDSEKYLMLTIRDTGHGIPKDMIDRIFDPYFTTKEKGEGTGLGLAIVQSIIQNHSGQILVQSEPGKGTAFYVYLPHAADDRGIQPADSPSDKIPGGRERILVVDDEEDIILIVKNMLTRLGYKVTTCLKSSAALERFQANPEMFDAVISDMTMPEMTGDMLAVCIKKIRPEIPVILCTGYSESLSVETYRSYGVEGLLMKPIAMMEMATTLREALDRSISARVGSTEEDNSVE